MVLPHVHRVRLLNRMLNWTLLFCTTVNHHTRKTQNMAHVVTKFTEIRYDSINLGRFDFRYGSPKFLFDAAMYCHSSVRRTLEYSIKVRRASSVKSLRFKAGTHYQFQFQQSKQGTAAE